MPIQPQPRRLKCQKCGYFKVVRPKSDALNPADFVQGCPKCGGMMKKSEDSAFSDVVGAVVGAVKNLWQK